MTDNMTDDEFYNWLSENIQNCFDEVLKDMLCANDEHIEQTDVRDTASAEKEN